MLNQHSYKAQHCTHTSLFIVLMTFYQFPGVRHCNALDISEFSGSKMDLYTSHVGGWGAGGLIFYYRHEGFKSHKKHFWNYN